ncbi:phosphoribosyltransferase [Micromonospora sp. KC606]|uniref:phosphoribosyltransferase n=1 Tax=Micromonospora sp. KC606 TaxID=2530379 RepID=UPI001042B8D9|nr:phosphoribosyltransferase [Micromonospora sp. KC606]TDC77937.1 phosphoribosyltransferase [Micromonospora sp. KC606]
MAFSDPDGPLDPDLPGRLSESFRWVDPGPGSSHLVSDTSGWWRDPQVLAALGPALVAPFRDARPTVVVAPAVTGLIIGPLAATALAVGFVPVHKPDDGRLPSGALTWAQSPPDFRGRRVGLAVRKHLIGPDDRVLMVDDWVATGAQAHAVREICAIRGARWLGVAAIVVDCPPEVAHELGVCGLLDSGRLT